MEELNSLQNQVKETRLQDNLGRQNFPGFSKKTNHVTDAMKNTSDNFANILTESSINNNKALENLNESVFEFLNDKGVIAPYPASFLVNLIKPENKSQHKLIEDSIRMKDLLINTSKPVTLCSIILIFRGSIRSFTLDGDLFETMANYDFNVDHSNPQNRKKIL